MDALLLIDLQNDFCAGGALAVPDGDAVVPVANRLMPRFEHVVATQDFHPPEHLSFAKNHPGKNVYDVIELDGLPQVLWPAHCVAHTRGADFHPQLDRARIREIVRKGTDPRIDSYSGFFDNGKRKATGLADSLRAAGVTDVYLLGLATDYCVRWTALDAMTLGFRVVLVADGCRGVGLQPDDVPNAIAEMQRAGVQVRDASEVLAARPPVR